MKNVRFTQPFAQVAADDVSSNDSLTPAPRRLSRLTPEMVRITQSLENIEIFDDLSPSPVNQFVELPDNPRHSVTLPSPAPTAALRATGTFTPISELVANASPVADQSFVEIVNLMKREELLVKAREAFTATYEMASELMALLQDADEDKTPTQAPRHPAKVRERLQRKMSQLKVLVDRADRQGQEQQLGEAALDPFAYRQYKELARALETFERNESNRRAGQGGPFSSEALLLAALQRICGDSETIRRRR